MGQESIYILKRDGSQQPYDGEKIRSAVDKAFRAAGLVDEEGYALRIESLIQTELCHRNSQVAVEEIQDRVEAELMNLAPQVAKKYIIYREWRTVQREKRTTLKRTMDGIVSIEKNDINLGNANVSAYTPSGQMMTFASEVTKDYAMKYLLSAPFARAHAAGDIHIHDLDYYPTKTATCVQYDLADLFERGFHTKNGSIRTPQNIQSYASFRRIRTKSMAGKLSQPSTSLWPLACVRPLFVSSPTASSMHIVSSRGEAFLTRSVRASSKHSVASSPLSLIPMLRPKPSL